MGGQGTMRAPRWATISLRHLVACVCGLLLMTWAVPKAATGDCCECEGANPAPCPSGAPQCFSTANVALCFDNCSPLGCPSGRIGSGVVCGQGSFADCAVIDGIPVPSKTPTSTPTST